MMDDPIYSQSTINLLMQRISEFEADMDLLKEENKALQEGVDEGIERVIALDGYLKEMETELEKQDQLKEENESMHNQLLTQTKYMSELQKENEKLKEEIYRLQMDRIENHKLGTNESESVSSKGAKRP